ncbi:MAG: hypothetical protein JWQ96_640 [Segetibacter sp.]|nr:hypothetical protein [Segetibacter sp.]
MLKITSTAAENTYSLKSDFIVLADDDLDDQELLIEAIKDINPKIELVTISNGNKAISFLSNLPDGVIPTLIVLDYNLPEANGSDILQSLLQNPKFDSVPKVIWSTSNSPVYKKACLALGADAYLVKPSDVAGIQDLAQHMLDMCSRK